MYPKVQCELHGHTADVNCCFFIPDEEVYITGSSDLSLRCWIRRDNGGWWPCSWETVDAPVSAVHFDRAANILIAGLENGNVLIYTVSHDFNSVKLATNIKAHNGAVSFLGYDVGHKVIMSCGKDGWVFVFSGDSHQQVGRFQCSGTINSAAYDSKKSALYCAMNSGDIVSVRIGENEASLKTTFKTMHTGSINDVCVDLETHRVYTGGNDNHIVQWDPDKPNTGIILQKHSCPVVSVTYVGNKNSLMSLDSSGKIVIWDMTAERFQAAEWTESDDCQICHKAFFWNVQKKTVDVHPSFSFPLPSFNTNRQHHCRKCGKAVCSQCTPAKRAIPIYGFEEQVFVCKECTTTLQEHELKTTIHEVHVLQGMQKIRWVPKTDTFVAIFSNFCVKAMSVP